MRVLECGCPIRGCAALSHHFLVENSESKNFDVRVVMAAAKVHCLLETGEEQLAIVEQFERHDCGGDFIIGYPEVLENTLRALYVPLCTEAKRGT